MQSLLLVAWSGIRAASCPHRLRRRPCRGGRVRRCRRACHALPYAIARLHNREIDGGVLLAVQRCMSTMRANSCHYCPAWISGLLLTLGILTLILAGACRQSVPVVDRPQPRGTKGVITTPAAPPARVC